MNDNTNDTNVAEEEINEEVKDNETENLKKEVEDYKHKYLRALADYQNLEKRARTDKIETIKSAQVQVVLELLPFLDNLDKAEVFIKDPGLKMIKSYFIDTLKSMGVEELQVLGKEFDPYTSEAIEVVSGEKDNIVVEVLRKGYKIFDQIIRVAQVKVSKKE